MVRLGDIIENVRPTLVELEKDRVDYRRRAWLYGPLALVPPVVALVAGIATGRMFAGVILCILLGTGGALLFHSQAGRYGAAFKRRYKELVVTRLLSLINPGLRYKAEAGIPEARFAHAELFQAGIDRYSTEDLIEGDYGKTTIALAEVHAEDRRTTTDSKGNTRTHYVTIFRGLLLVADFHKHFHGRTFVFPDTAEKLFGGFGRTLQKLGGRRDTELVELEDPEFEEAFAVYGTDQVEARYILSTAMMRRILDMRNRFGKDVRIAFKDSCLWLAVPHRNSYLEPKTSVAATDESQIEGLLEEMRLFLDTIDELDLNTRIWTKE